MSNWDEKDIRIRVAQVFNKVLEQGVDIDSPTFDNKLAKYYEVLKRNQDKFVKLEREGEADNLARGQLDFRPEEQLEDNLIGEWPKTT